MDVGTRSGALANAIGRAQMISVREKNTAYASPRQFIQHFIVRLDRVDADIPGGIGDQQAVEVLTMRLGKP